MSALKIVCKRKISRRLRKNPHITVLSIFSGEIIFEVLKTNVITVCTNVADGRHTVALPRGKTKEIYYRCRRYLKSDMDHHYTYTSTIGRN